MSEKKKSPDELLDEVIIHQVEKEALERVFGTFVSKSEDPRAIEKCEKFGWQEVYQVLRDLENPLSKQDVQLMVWEVDEDLDGYVSKEEFEIMYKRCVSDKTGLEPRKLFNLVQFMMFDKNNNRRITVEDTLELIYVRYGMEHLEKEIQALFGPDEKKVDGTEKSISFSEYLAQINEKIFKREKKVKQKRKIIN
jgi:Ca2+-binding EF-hand superfamily protein